MAISHIDGDQRVYGPQNTATPGNPVRYFINPIGIHSIILSATELGPSTVLTTDNLEPTSVNAILSPWSGSTSKITFPLVQGMGFVTAIYRNLQPAIHSDIFFRGVASAGSSRNGIYKYWITLEDNKSWLLYAVPSDGQNPQLSLVSNSSLRGLPGWSGFIQVAKNPAGLLGEASYDGSAGVYPTTASITASTFGQTGTYRFQWKKAGISSGQYPTLLMYALPHHVESFAGPTIFCKTAMKLQTTTKGMATAVIADEWTIVEPNLPVDMDFAPWDLKRPSGSRSVRTLSASALNVIIA
ncbi:MAG: hypothetical protein Q9214_005754, partial [Letrouitia sp. 1 TL-2023]